MKLYKQFIVSPHAHLRLSQFDPDDTARFNKGDYRAKVIVTKYLIHQTSDTMDIFIADLHKDAARIREKLLGDFKSVSQVSEIRVNTERPRIAIRANHFCLAG